jgi:hypothetical protein
MNTDKDSFSYLCSSVFICGFLILSGVAFSAVSHRDALRSGARCLDCHAAMATSTTAARPGPRGVRFNHKLHLGFDNVAPLIAGAVRSKKYLGPPPSLDGKEVCQACHRGLEQAIEATPANFPHMADCLVCHSKIDNPFSCEKCHSVRAVQLKPAFHTSDYVDTHSSGKLKLDKPSCVICHGVNFTCLGCH